MNSVLYKWVQPDIEGGGLPKESGSAWFG